MENTSFLSKVTNKVMVLGAALIMIGIVSALYTVLSTDISGLVKSII